MANQSAVATLFCVGASGMMSVSVPCSRWLQKEFGSLAGSLRDHTASWEGRRCPVSSTISGSLLGDCNWNGIPAIRSTGESGCRTSGRSRSADGIDVSHRFTFGPARSSSAVTVAKYALAGFLPHSPANPVSDTTTPAIRNAIGTTANVRTWTVLSDSTTAKVSGIERSDQ